MKKLIYKILGIISLSLGVIGIFLPILPTTPFLLLSSWLFLRSSDKLYNWLMDHPVLGIYIKSYTKYKGIRKDHKILALASLWITMLISISLIEKNLIKFLLLLIAIGVSIHLLSFKTLSKKDISEIERMEEKLKEDQELKKDKANLNMSSYYK